MGNSGSSLLGDRLLGVLRRVLGLKSQLPAFPVFQARLGLDAA
jgi:hypothetical protein